MTITVLFICVGMLSMTITTILKIWGTLIMTIIITITRKFQYDFEYKAVSSRASFPYSISYSRPIRSLYFF